ncbi:MAG: LETM1-domain-containing protein [Lentinula lateritia]|nr:MAG: LETM1-domain-containing protein [Lentinula lateritia]
MSLIWLPRPMPAFLSRSHSHSQYVLRSYSVFLLRTPSYLHPSVFNVYPSRRFQSSQPLGSKPSGPPVSVVPHTSAEVKPLPPATAESPKGPLLIRAWTKVKHEILHGEQLTQRERRQLKRNTQDLLRLVPFAVFVIVPLMELLLPVAFKLFPNMLPSTFEDKFATEEKQRKLLRSRLEMAKFLQETLRESPLKANAHIIGCDAFKAFFLKVRSIGESPSASDIINLVWMCRYMDLNAFGTDNFLQGALRSRLLTLRRDDQLIDAEGVDSLSTFELQGACQSRRIRISGVSPARLREELSTWISLHLHNHVSDVLLIVGCAFNFDRQTGEDADGKTNVIKSLELVLSGLPDNLIKASYKQKLEVFQQQEELIEDEEEQQQKEEDARLAKIEAEEREAQSAQALLPDTELVPESVKAEGLKKLGEALCILSIRSSGLNERSDLPKEDPKSPSGALTKRIRTMLTKIDKQLGEYDSRVGSSLQMISQNVQGRIPVQDLQKALAIIKHRRDDEIGQAVIQKLDVDKDGFEGLGIVLDNDAQTLIRQGREIKNSKSRKEDIVQED